MRMQYKTIGEINHYASENVNPARFPEQYFELYSVPHFSEGHPEIIKGKDVGATKQVVQEGDVLICKINPRINRVWKVTRHTDYPLIASSEWVIVRNADLNADYLTYYFSSPKFRVLINSELTGMGGSLIRAQPKQIRRYSVPVPDKEEQHFVVRNLALLDHLISLRQQQAEKLDELVKARFVEMFGECKYEGDPLSNVCKLITDGTHQPPQFVDAGIPFLLVSNLVHNEITYDTEKFISKESYQELIKRTPVEIGDILLSIVGSYGHAGVVRTDKPFCFQRHIAYIKPDFSKLNSEFLHQALLSDAVKYQMEKRVKGIAQKTLNLSELKKIVVPIPPLALQTEFSHFVHEVDREKERIQRSAALLETLKRSLMQQYFG